MTVTCIWNRIVYFVILIKKKVVVVAVVAFFSSCDLIPEYNYLYGFEFKFDISTLEPFVPLCCVSSLCSLANCFFFFLFFKTTISEEGTEVVINAVCVW